MYIVKRIKFRVLVFIIFIGIIVGSVLGELIGLIMPDGVVKNFFLISADIGISPTTIDLNLIKFTLGFSLKVNVIGIIGIAIAAYLLKWYK